DLNALETLIRAVRKFRDERDWSQFHTPKNLAAAIAIEASELQECFLWKTDNEITDSLKDTNKRQAVIDEVADVLLFTILLADGLDIDIADAITNKLVANAQKYPVSLARGNSQKYTELKRE
ncbi:MAG: nucleotide pyrophosphohydrolase, partial [Pirellulales bacterium]